MADVQVLSNHQGWYVLFNDGITAHRAKILDSTLVDGHRLVINVRPSATKKAAEVVASPDAKTAAGNWRFLSIAKKNKSTKAKPPTPESLKRRRPSYSSSDDDRPARKRSPSTSSISSLSDDDDVPLARNKPLPLQTPISDEGTPVDEPMPLVKELEDVPKKGKKRAAKPKVGKAAKKARLDEPVIEIPPPVEPPVAEIKLDEQVPIISDKPVKPKPVKPPKVVKPKKPAKTELDKFLEGGAVQDEEDAYWLGQALAATHHEVAPDLSDDEMSEDETAVKEGHPLFHTAGSWRAQGWKKVPQIAKVEYLPERNRAVVSKDDASALTTGRTARVTGRRLAHDMETTRKTASSAATAESDLFAFNQLRIRKKQLRFSRSPIEGYGLYAMETINPGEMVCEYVGEVCRSAVADIREQRYLRQGIGSSYLFRVDNDLVCDATFKGSVRYVEIRL